MGRWGGRPDRRWTTAVLAEYGDRCHLCGHPGADSADHLRPRKTHPHLAHDVANGRPVHHAAPCPVCGIRCNIRRKAKPLLTAPAVDDLAFFDTWPGHSDANASGFVPDHSVSDRKD